MFRYSATQWIFGQEPLEETLGRLKRCGYDGIELTGEPDAVDADAVLSLLDVHGLVCSSICGMYPPERDLSSLDDAVRKRAVAYVKLCVDFAKAVGAPAVIVVPSHVGKSHLENPEQEWANAVRSVQEAGRYALENGITIVIEALNRYEARLVHNLHLGRLFVEEVGLDSVKLMADLFHMNIEERDHVASLEHIAPYLAHVHIADNTREAAGMGQIDFEPVLSHLKENAYNGWISMEFMPPAPNPYAVAGGQSVKTTLDEWTKQSIDHMKKLERGV